MIKGRVKLLCAVGIILTLVGGVWWWQWQAPYRTLTTFLRALERGDIDTLYALSLDKERELGLTKEVVERTYYQCLKPTLAQHRLLRIERRSKELRIRERFVEFWLWFEGLKRPIIVCPVRWPGTHDWRIPFSATVSSLIRYLIAKDDDLQTATLLHRLGHKMVVTSLGSIRDVAVVLETAKGTFRRSPSRFPYSR